MKLLERPSRQKRRLKVLGRETCLNSSNKEMMFGDKKCFKIDIFT
jgi:hypothetical protein